MSTIGRITPNLWFDSNAEEAARFYVGIFRNSSLGKITYYGKEGYEIHGRKEGSVMTVSFNLDGQDFVALNGGPHFRFNEAISFIVTCVDQREVDHYWNKLGAGGDPKAQQCGWLKDKFGLSWQVVPEQLNRFIADSDKDRAGRVMNAMLQMKKLDLAALKAAYEGTKVTG